MKKLLISILTFLSITLLTSCNGSGGDESLEEDFGVQNASNSTVTSDSGNSGNSSGGSSGSSDSSDSNTPSETSTGGAELVVAAGCPQSISVGSIAPVPIKMLAVNSDGDPIESSTVSFSVSGGIGGSVSNASVDTDSDGLANITFTAGGSAGTAIITASSTQGSAACSIEVTAIGDYTIAKYDAGNTDAQSGDINSALANSLSVRVTETGVPVSAVSITFEILTGDGSVDGSSSSTVSTNTSGIATADWTLGPDVGAQSVKATIVGDATETVTFTGTGTANFDVGTSTIASGVTVMTAFGATGDDQTTTVTLTLKDGSGDPVTLATGQTIVFSATQGSFFGSVADGGDGTYTQSFRASTTTGTATVSATVNTVAVTDTHDITIDHGDLDLASSTFAATTPALPPDGSSTTTLRVNLKDSLGNIFDDASTVTITQDSGTGSLAVVTDDGNGQYSALLTAPGVAGNGQFTATANASTVGSQIEVIYADLAGTTINCTNGNYATWANKDLYVSGGTLIIDNYDGATGTEECTMTFRSITVGVGGIITTSSPTTSDVGGIQVTVTNDLTVDVGGKIDVSNLGYPQICSGSTNGYTQGLDQTAGSIGVNGCGSGGSHGGLGSVVNDSYTCRVNEIYDSASNPVYPGASGSKGTNWGGCSGAGGGVIRITAANIINNAEINAIGEDFSTNHGGGGAGGSIYLNVSGTITGSGSFSVQGGNSYSNTVSGGGGRIAFIGDDTGIDLDQISVDPGPKSTIYNEASGGTFYRSLGGYVGTVTLSSEISINYNESPSTNIFSSSTDLIIASGGTLNTSNPLSLSSLTIQSGGTVTHGYMDPGSTAPMVDLTVTNDVTIDSGGAIDVDKRGWPELSHFNNSQACGLGDGGICASSASSGGNHYTRGGGTNAYITWGDPTDPMTYGGASASYSGGGVIRITCDELDLTGEINAQGSGADGWNIHTSAGGSIKITANTAVFNVGNSISARGGENPTGTSSSTGAGGLIYLDIGSSTGTVNTDIISPISLTGGARQGSDGVLTIAP